MASGSAVDPTYWEYIGLDRLLRLQGGVDGEGDVGSADELHFIVIHQSIELLFKLVLRELRETRAALNRPHLEEDAIPDVALHLARVNEALRVTAGHFAFMETLGTQGFLSFRDKLGTSSGAQSFQMRELLEELLGLPRAERERVLARLRSELPRPEAVAAFEGFILEPLETIGRRIERQIRAKREQGADAEADRFVLDYVESARADIAARGTLRTSLARWLFRTPIYGSAPSARTRTRSTATTAPSWRASSTTTSSAVAPRVGAMRRRRPRAPSSCRRSCRGGTAGFERRSCSSRCIRIFPCSPGRAFCSTGSSSSRRTSSRFETGMRGWWSG